MNVKKMLQFIDFLEKKNQWIFTFNQAKIYFGEDDFTLQKSLAEHVESTLIVELTANIYGNLRSRKKTFYASEALLFYLRPNEFNYISLEEVLSNWSIISQVCRVMTCMTTGKDGIVRTRIGTFEFTHFDKPKDNAWLQDLFWNSSACVWEASPKLAYEDFKKYRPQTIWHMVDLDVLNESILEYNNSK